MYKKYFALACLVLLAGCGRPPDDAPRPNSPASVAADMATPQYHTPTVAKKLESTEPTTPTAIPTKSVITTQSTLSHLSGKSLLVSGILEFKTKDVVKSADEIENLALSNGGYVQSSHIYNEEHGSKSYPISNSEQKTLTSYIRRANITVRIPKQNVGAFLQSIQGQVEFLDKKEFVAQDVSLDIQKSQLEAKIKDQEQSALQDTTPKNTDTLSEQADIISEQSRAKQEELYAKLQEQSLQDQVALSTFSLSFYESMQVRQSLSPNVEATIAKESVNNFGTQFGESLHAGWRAFLSLMLWFVYLLPFVGVLFVLLWGSKKLLGKLRQKHTKTKPLPPDTETGSANKPLA